MKTLKVEFWKDISLELSELAEIYGGTMHSLKRETNYSPGVDLLSARFKFPNETVARDFADEANKMSRIKKINFVENTEYYNKR